MTLTPEHELDLLLDTLDEGEDTYCACEALNLLRKWESQNTPLETQRVEVDAFFLRWGFVGYKASAAASRTMIQLRKLLKIP